MKGTRANGKVRPFAVNIIGGTGTWRDMFTVPSYPSKEADGSLLFGLPASAVKIQLGRLSERHKGKLRTISINELCYLLYASAPTRSAVKAP